MDFPVLYHPRKTLTLDQACRVALLDDWLLELDGVSGRILRHEPNYRILSRLWEIPSEPIAELDDPARQEG